MLDRTSQSYLHRCKRDSLEVIFMERCIGIIGYAIQPIVSRIHISKFGESYYLSCTEQYQILENRTCGSESVHSD